nr:endonuclease/exonuclease/phosphatase family protein [Tranquillimonas alkanivorans]
MLWLTIAAPAGADSLRLAFFNTELSRDGPGLLLRDIRRGDPQAQAVATIVAQVAPDVLVLSGIDYDRGGAALAALAAEIEKAGHTLPHHFARRPNAGLATQFDLDGDGRFGTARDAQGYGRFAGDGGLAILSRLPVETGRVREFSGLLWTDLPGADPPHLDGVPFPDAETFAVQRLSSNAHWDVPLRLPGGRVLHLLVFHATPPVFDGPEDRNGRRNHDEAALWLRYLDGRLPQPPPEAPLVVMGDANLDPQDGEGRRSALQALLSHARLQDPRPRSEGARAAAQTDGGANADHQGPPRLDTVDWPDAPGPGNLRVDYVLPSRDLRVTGSGVFWPPLDDPLNALLLHEGVAASRHRLVWVDVTLPRGR